MKEFSVKSDMNKRMTFELFKSEVCHQVKFKGELNFIIDSLEEDIVRQCWNKEWFPEAFYVLAMVDYLSRLHHLPLSSEYSDIRQYKLPNIVFPLDVVVAAELSSNLDLRSNCLKDAIPEFLRFNIVESEIHNVC